MNFLKDIGLPIFSAMPTTMTFADAPMAVPFPPRHAPSASDHHIGIRSGWCKSCMPERFGQSCFAMSIINGFMVATYGMLSINADANAENHMTTMLVPG